MFRKFSNWLRKKSSGWVTLIALIIFILFTALVLPGQASNARENTGFDRSPDMSFFYSADDLYQMAEAYGETGRAAYIRARFTFDLIWPLVYAMFLITSISWLYGKAVKPGSAWQLANLSPVLGLAFDYLENIASSTVMARYPSRTLGIDQLAPLLTLVKWVFVGGSFLLLAIGIGFALWHWAQNKLASKARKG